MPLVAAFLVPGQPLHFLRPAEPPYSALVAGHAQAAQALAAYVEAAKAEGRVARALARHGIEGAAVAPPGDAGA